MTSTQTYPDLDRVSREFASGNNSEVAQARASHKRKRDSPGLNGRTAASRQQDQPQGAYYTTTDSHNDYAARSTIDQEIARHVANASPSSTTAAAALAASMPQLTVPQPTDVSFQAAPNADDPQRQLDASFDISEGSPNQPHHGDVTSPYRYAAGANGEASGYHASPSGGKPVVGTEEWHKVRKDNHKEVERRRRELINEGINELAKIVPDGDKNKGAVLQRGVSYIAQLKENEKRNIEKWTLEKMLTDQAISELTSSVDKLKDELGRARREAERWRGIAADAGADVSGESQSQRDLAAPSSPLRGGEAGVSNERGRDRERRERGGNAR